VGVRPEGVRSLDVISEEVRVERETQQRYFDGLDAKAGILLGFAGILIALARGDGPVILAARLVAATSGVLALAAFWPRDYWVTNLRRLREKYLSSEPDFTRLHLLDTHTGMAETLRPILLRKARLIKGSMTALAASAVFVAFGLGLD
jgi:hypothetical protein